MPQNVEHGVQGVHGPYTDNPDDRMCKRAEQRQSTWTRSDVTRLDFQIFSNAPIGGELSLWVTRRETFPFTISISFAAGDTAG